MLSFHAARLRSFQGGHPPNEIAFGYRTVSLVHPDALTDAQLGYAIDPAGRVLTGRSPGDWSPDWLVIGDEDQTGDPIFVDTRYSDWPVYTAAHGEGAWEPLQIADSLPKFLAALELVREVAVGRETPVALEGNPITAGERDRILDRIQRANPNAELDFWQTWFEQ